ncbi:hypothetical protein, partial [Dyella sp. ASV21]|uniref:hypothetical protein n=1 Tax=Dyella sp. ASV21 TaxID=2795114 RepID=UPI001E301728
GKADDIEGRSVGRVKGETQIGWARHRRSLCSWQERTTMRPAGRVTHPEKAARAVSVGRTVRLGMPTRRWTVNAAAPIRAGGCSTTCRRSRSMGQDARRIGMAARVAALGAQGQPVMVIMRGCSRAISTTAWYGWMLECGLR